MSRIWCSNHLIVGRNSPPSSCFAGCCEGPGSSRWRMTAVLAGLSAGGPPAALPYGDSYSSRSPRPISPPASDRIDLPLLRLPDDELELLSVFGAVGVKTAEIGMRVVGGNGGLASSTSSAVSAAPGPALSPELPAKRKPGCGLICSGVGGAGPGSLEPSAAALACVCALVGRPLFRLTGGSGTAGCMEMSAGASGFGRISRPPGYGASGWKDLLRTPPRGGAESGV